MRDFHAEAVRIWPFNGTSPGGSTARTHETAAGEQLIWTEQVHFFKRGARRVGGWERPAGGEGSEKGLRRELEFSNSLSSTAS